MIKRIALLLLFISSMNLFALDIDEKLTMRILDISSTGKTLLINRGVEDGLVVGDHAKFFVTTGVIARGVVIKVSPTRSIWSLYRVIEAEEITKDRVLSLKISAPVKVTADPSRSVKTDDEPSVGIEVAQEADDLPKDLSKSEQDDLAGLMDEEKPSKSKKAGEEGVDGNKLWQAYVQGSYLSLTSTLTEGSAQSNYGTTEMVLGAGIERYFEASSFLSNLSLFAFGEMSFSSSADLENIEPSSYMQIGGGLSYHILNTPLAYGKVIPYISVSGGMGSAKVTYSETESNGKTNFISAGGGFKYNWKSGLGMRVSASYYQRNETYTFEGGSIDQITYAHSGYGAQVGISYRF